MSQIAVFLEFEFFALIIFTLALPIGIYWFLYRRYSISRITVIGLSIALIVIGGVDVVLLKKLDALARLTPAMVDNLIFSSEISFALYIIPAAFAGIGVNLLSHLLIDHLHRAESRHDRDGRLRR